MLGLIFLIIQLGFVIYLLYMCIAFITGAPYVPTNPKAASAMIRLANINKGTIVFDLGSGDGKLLQMAANRGAQVLGYEINPILVLWSNMRGRATRWKNFWHADVSKADVIFLYLLPNRMEKLASKLKKECKPGAIIVSNSFIFPHWDILRKDVDNHVYVFRV